MAQPAPRSPYQLVPPGLILLRVALGPAIFIGARLGWPGYALAAMLGAGLLSDIFDGVVARRIGTATPRLRQADSTADIIFWLFAAAGAATTAPGFIPRHAWWLSALLVGEAACQSLSFARFHRPVATHSYAAKCWGLLLFTGFAWLLDARPACWFIDIVLGWGLIVYAEALAMLAVSPTYPVDVKTAVHVMRKTFHPPS